MFKLPLLPSAKADCHELADFAELLAWQKGATSAREIAAYLGRLDDNARNDGCDDDEDDTTNDLDAVMIELQRRGQACGVGYPFTLDSTGTVLRHVVDDTDARAHTYRYLLLATRLNMLTNRIHSRIDGGLLLEELAGHVLKCYLGSKRAKSIIFGTATPGSFKSKVNDLCQKLGEGGRFRTLDVEEPDENDGKLDNVAWVPFSDCRRNQLIIFNQCKTGTTWRQQTPLLQPAEFIKKWMLEPLFLDPIRAFCIAESAGRGHWCANSIDAGLFFDRCRLVDYCEDLPVEILDKTKKWTKAAFATSTLAKTVKMPRKQRQVSAGKRTMRSNRPAR